MEIYKDLSSPASQQFEKLLNTQLSKNKIEEGKIIEGKITKITEKYVFARDKTVASTKLTEAQKKLFEEELQKYS